MTCIYSLILRIIVLPNTNLVHDLHSMHYLTFILINVIISVTLRFETHYCNPSQKNTTIILLSYIVGGKQL